jgi:hypothetical protein
MATDFRTFTTFEGEDYLLQRYPTKRHVVPSKMQRELAFAARISARAHEIIARHEAKIIAQHQAIVTEVLGLTAGPEVVEVGGGVL